MISNIKIFINIRENVSNKRSTPKYWKFEKIEFGVKFVLKKYDYANCKLQILTSFTCWNRMIIVLLRSSILLKVKSTALWN